MVRRGLQQRAPARLTAGAPAATPPPRSTGPLACTAPILQADDPELEAIRQRRMAQLMQQQGGGTGAPKSAEEMQASSSGGHGFA